jgi:transcriptional regulator with GAF, ATPase, and Fis domain
MSGKPSPRDSGGAGGPIPVSHRSDHAVLASAYGQLLGLLVEAPKIDAVLEKMVRLAAEVVTPAAACGVTVRRDGRPFTAAMTDELAARADEIQYDSGEGPCLDALRHGVVVQVDDLTREGRWDGYRPHAVAHGVRSSLSLPLTVEGETLGALNLYSVTPAAFGGAHRESAEDFADRSAAALTVSLRQVRHARVQHQLAQAMVSNSVIDQAIGILMGQQRCTANAAFDLLRSASQRRNRKLRDIATEIVTSVSGAPPQPRPGFRADPPDRGRGGRDGPTPAGPDEA